MQHLQVHGRPLVAILLTVAMLAPTIGHASKEDAQACARGLGQSLDTASVVLEDELQILSWNIQKASNVGWAEDLSNFSGDIHLAFIQEASTQAPIAQTIPVPLYQAFAAGYTTDSEETGVLTLSTSSPSLHCNLTAWEPWLGTPKATSITEYPLRDRDERLLAINMHAVNFAMGLQGFQQQIHALEELLVEHQGPVIIAGDLNTWSAGRQQLVDTFMQRFALTAVDFAPDLRTTAFGRALDHIYIRGMKPHTAEVIPVSSSDHNPLRVSLQIL